MAICTFYSGLANRVGTLANPPAAAQQNMVICTFCNGLVNTKALGTTVTANTHAHLQHFMAI